MDLFAAVAAAHALALLIPGVDFFLIARTAMTSGWRTAVGTCAGIATANGVFIAAAFTGLAVVRNPMVLTVIQFAGGLFLIYIGVAFLRARPALDVDSGTTGVRGWWRNYGLGLGSGLLNPKNAIFYVSLGAALADASPPALVGYGVWMVVVVFTWDVFVATALGSRRALGRMGALLPWLAKASGAFLVVFGAVMVAAVLW